MVQTVCMFRRLVETSAVGSSSPTVMAAITERSQNGLEHYYFYSNHIVQAFYTNKPTVARRAIPTKKSIFIEIVVFRESRR